MDGPLVVDVKRGSLDDGPGIRSVVFFKGCPLRCVWCQNPETRHPRAEIQRLPGSCVGCRACVDACPTGRARPATEPQPADRECRMCLACVDACPSASRRVAGRPMPVDELVEQGIAQGRSPGGQRSERHRESSLSAWNLANASGQLQKQQGLSRKSDMINAI